MSPVRNVAACLVHDSFECVIDLVQNIHFFSPETLILLYNGGRDRDLLPASFPFARYNAVVHPGARPQRWGRLHEFVFDSIAFALESYSFSSFTVVDSDQLMIRSGYAEYLEQYFRGNPRVGLLGTSSRRIVQTDQFGPARTALDEIGLWQPLLDRFPNGGDQFVHWTFWPATVFSYDATAALHREFGNDVQLQTILQNTSIIATEEVVFPTLVALLGFEVEKNPCDDRLVRFRIDIEPEDVEGTGGILNNAYWAHPVPRRYDDGTRQYLRSKYNGYSPYPHTAGYRKSGEILEGNVLASTAIIVAQRAVGGWLDDNEAALLAAAVERACKLRGEEPVTIVEVGSFQGKSTVVLGLALRAGGNPGKVFSIDRFDGCIGAHDGTITQGPPTYEIFLQNVASAGLSEVVQPIQSGSHNVQWDQPIDFLLVDGYHDYPNVARDFHHFAGWLRDDAVVAFHDYASYYPGVRGFVDELLVSGDYELVGRAGTLVVLRQAPKSAPTPPLHASADPGMDNGALSRNGVSATDGPVGAAHLLTQERPGGAA